MTFFSIVMYNQFSEIFSLLTLYEWASQLSHVLFFTVEIYSLRFFQLKSTHLNIFIFKYHNVKKAFFLVLCSASIFSASLHLPLRYCTGWLNTTKSASDNTLAHLSPLTTTTMATARQMTTPMAMAMARQTTTATTMAMASKRRGRQLQSRATMPIVRCEVAACWEAEAMQRGAMQQPDGAN